MNQCSYFCATEEVIYSDSRAALLALDSSSITSRLAKDTIESSNSTANSTNKITLRWVKGYADHAGNEAADSLAKKGAQEHELMVTDIPLPSAKLLKNRLKECVEMVWQWDWTTNQPCRQTKYFFSEISKQQSMLLATTGKTTGNRKLFSAYVQLVRGHNYLNAMHL